MASKVTAIKDLPFAKDGRPVCATSPRRKPPVRKPWEPTKKERQLVALCSAAGMSQDQIAAAVGMERHTLEKHCSDELRYGATRCNARVVGKLFDKCMKGDTVSLLFWCKTRLGWNEKQQIEHTGKDGGPIAYERVEAEAAAFTDHISKMAERFAVPEPANDAEGEVTPEESTEAAEG